MGGFIEAGSTEDLKDGARKKLTVDGREIMVARVGDSYYAVQNRCPHMGGSLSAGRLEGTVITCPLHGSKFDLRDGRVVRWLKGPSGLLSAMAKLVKPPRPLETYKVKIEGGRVLVEV